MPDRFVAPRIYVLLPDLWHPPAFYEPLARTCREHGIYLFIADLFSPACTTAEGMVVFADRIVTLAQRAMRRFSASGPTVIVHGATGILLPELARRWRERPLTLQSLICCNAWLPAPGSLGLDTLAPPLSAAFSSQFALPRHEQDALPYTLFRRYWYPEVCAAEEETVRLYTQLVACRNEIIRYFLFTPTTYTTDLAELRVPKIFLYCASSDLDPAAEPLLANWYLAAQQLAPSFSVLSAPLPHEAPVTAPRYFVQLIEQAREDRGLPFSPAQPESNLSITLSHPPAFEQK